MRALTEHLPFVPLQLIPGARAASTGSTRHRSTPYAPVSGGFDNSVKCRFAQVIPAINPTPNSARAAKPRRCSVVSVNIAKATMHVVPIPKEIMGPLSRTKITTRLTALLPSSLPLPFAGETGLMRFPARMHRASPAISFPIESRMRGARARSASTPSHPHTLFNTS